MFHYLFNFYNSFNDITFYGKSIILYFYVQCSFILTLSTTNFSLHLPDFWNSFGSGFLWRKYKCYFIWRVLWVRIMTEIFCRIGSNMLAKILAKILIKISKNTNPHICSLFSCLFDPGLECVIEDPINL